MVPSIRLPTNQPTSASPPVRTAAQKPSDIHTKPNTRPTPMPIPLGVIRCLSFLVLSSGGAAIPCAVPIVRVVVAVSRTVLVAWPPAPRLLVNQDALESIVAASPAGSALL